MKQVLLIVNARYGFERFFTPKENGVEVIGPLVYSNSCLAVQFEYEGNADSYNDSYWAAIKRTENEIFEKLKAQDIHNSIPLHQKAQNPPQWLLFSVVKEFEEDV